MIKIGAGRFAVAPVATALLALTIVALHGWLPGAPDRADAPHTPGSSTTPLLVGGVGLLVLLAAWGARRPAAAPVPAVELPPERLDIRDRRAVAIAAAALVVLLAVMVGAALLPRGADSTDVRQPPPSSAPAQSERTGQPPPPPAQPGEESPPNPWPLLAGAALLMVLAVTAVGRGPALVRGAPAIEPTEPARTGPPSLVAVTELGLAEILDRTRAPRAAIIACYAALERGLAESAELAPHPSDTPAEVLARVVRAGAVPPAPVAELVELFTEARFSPHLMVEQQRDRAIDRLRLVLAALRSPS